MITDIDHQIRVVARKSFNFLYGRNLYGRNCTEEILIFYDLGIDCLDCCYVVLEIHAAGICIGGQCMYWWPVSFAAFVLM